MAMGRFNRPSIMIYGGAIAPGHTTLSDPPKVINVSSTFEAYGALLQGEIDEKNYQDIVRNACPGAGGCGGLYTASTSIILVVDDVNHQWHLRRRQWGCHYPEARQPQPNIP